MAEEHGIGDSTQYVVAAVDEEDVHVAQGHRARSFVVVEHDAGLLAVVANEVEILTAVAAAYLPRGEGDGLAAERALDPAGLLIAQALHIDVLTVEGHASRIVGGLRLRQIFHVLIGHLCQAEGVVVDLRTFGQSVDGTLTGAGGVDDVHHASTHVVVGIDGKNLMLAIEHPRFFDVGEDDVFQSAARRSSSGQIVVLVVGLASQLHFGNGEG